MSPFFATLIKAYQSEMCSAFLHKLTLKLTWSKVTVCRVSRFEHVFAVVQTQDISQLDRGKHIKIVYPHHTAMLSESFHLKYYVTHKELHRATAATNFQLDLTATRLFGTKTTVENHYFLPNKIRLISTVSGLSWKNSDSFLLCLCWVRYVNNFNSCVLAVIFPYKHIPSTYGTVRLNSEQQDRA